MPRFSLGTVFFPGMIFHELSHYIACILFGVKVHRVKLFGANEAFVVHDQPVAWKAIIITLSPFILGTFVGLKLFSFGIELLIASNLLSIIFFWFALSLFYYSFPSLQDSKNAFYSTSKFYSKAIFGRRALVWRIFWLLTFPFVFIPLILALGVMLAFNYSSKLRIVWILLLIVFSLNPLYLSSLFDFLQNAFFSVFAFLRELSGTA